ncbi:TPA: hypothetical protein ACXYK5_002739 [Legionella pneumophila]
MDVHAQALVGALAAVYDAGQAISSAQIQFAALAAAPESAFVAAPELLTQGVLDFQAVSAMRIPMYHGVVGGTERLIRQLRDLNAAKAVFREAIRAYKVAHQLQRTVRVHQVLQEAGFAPLHLNAVTRELQFLDFTPRWVHYSRVRHSARQKITKAQAHARLAALTPGPAVATQIDQLRFADRDLVIHRDLAVWVVNAVGFAEGGHPAPRVRRFTSLPLVYLHEAGYPNPEVGYSVPRKARKPRADKRTEDDVFLSSLHAYRYKTRSPAT